MLLLLKYVIYTKLMNCNTYSYNQPFKILIFIIPLSNTKLNNIYCYNTFQYICDAFMLIRLEGLALTLHLYFNCGQNEELQILKPHAVCIVNCCKILMKVSGSNKQNLESTSQT